LTGLVIAEAASALDIEQVRDIRRSVLCGELNWPRETVEDPADSGAILFLASLGPKPLASARLIKREGQWHIESLAVLQRFRRQGIGRALLAAMEARAASSTHIFQLGPNQAFFSSCGYLEISGPHLVKAI
jgi:ribosomal protein S18 acetylase RimI-like enzyme